MTTQTTMTLLPPFSRNDGMPPVTSVRLPTSDGGELILHNTIQLGHHTSVRDQHYNHNGIDFAPKQQRCSACRWFEVALYRTPNDYVLWSCGHTIVPDENPRINVNRTANEFTIIELMTVRKGSNVFLPQPSALVLASAAKYDAGIQDAYVNRATP